MKWQLCMVGIIHVSLTPLSTFILVESGTGCVFPIGKCWIVSFLVFIERCDLWIALF